MASFGLNKWLWAMFEPTPTWPNLDFELWLDKPKLGQIMTLFNFSFG